MDNSTDYYDRMAKLNKELDMLNRDIAVKKEMIKRNELALLDLQDIIVWGLSAVGVVVIAFLAVYGRGLV